MTTITIVYQLLSEVDVQSTDYFKHNITNVLSLLASFQSGQYFSFIRLTNSTLNDTTFNSI
uniref:Uncharacterized protein n=1 Tax=Heterorhabditis bacteriophora TaxID=37862 RepID=A0A1I7X215_HETBA